MAENTNIEWCDHTMNFWIGCSKVSKACDRCYAAVSTPARAMKVGWGPGVPRHRTAPATWDLPKRWNKRHAAFFAKHGRRQRVFALSLGDWLDKEVPIAWLADMLEVVRTTPNLDWLLLTKRIGIFESRLNAAHLYALHHGMEELASWIREWLNGNPPVNVWLGITICDQAEADRDIPKLLAVPAAKRFLSMEPLLGPVDLTRLPMRDTCASECCGNWRLDALKGASYCGDVERDPATENDEAESRIDWVIVGGESGPGARPMHPDWARSLRDQCQAAGVAFLFKQWGEWGTAAFNTGTGLPVFRQFPDFQTWVNKARTWVNGGICLDGDGRELKNGGDMARARDAGKFPVTIMHKVGKKAAGRLLDGRTWDGFPT